MRFLRKLRALILRRSRERDLDREVRAHLTLLADEFETRGMSPELAREAARRSFGSVALARELGREAASPVWIEQVFQDLRHAARALVRQPGFTLVAVATLALGIGVNATFFTAYNTLALKPLPVADPGRVMRLERWLERGFLGDIQYNFSYPEYIYCRDHNGVFDGLVAASWPVRVAAQNEPETFNVELVSSNYFRDLGVPVASGRALVDEDEHERRPVLVVSDAFWRRRYNADPSAAGRTMVINGVAFTVIGVASERFNGTSVGLQAPDFWAPLWMQRTLAPARDWIHDPTWMQLQLLARLRPSTTRKRAEAETQALIAQFSTTYDADERTKAVTLQRTSLLGNTEDPRFEATVAGLMMLLAMVLMVACANLANMLLARGAARRQEMGVRMALGAGRARLVRHLLTESVVLALAGGAAGLLFSIWGSRILWAVVQQMLAGPLTRGLVIRVDFAADGRVFLYTLALSILAAIAFGLAPALRSAGADLTTAIKDDGGTFGARLTRSRLRSAMVAGQVAVSMLLLITAGLLLRGMIRSQSANPGFEAHRVYRLAASFGDTPAKAAAVERRLIERLETMPAIRSAALGTAPLLGTWTTTITIPSRGSILRGRTLAGYASEAYFDALGIPLVRGRVFTLREAGSGARVAVVSESAARHFWPGEDPLGKRFDLEMSYARRETAEFEVTGIAKDVRFANLTRVDPARVYLATSSAASYDLLVRIQGDAKSAADAVRTALREIDPSMLAGMSFVSIEDGPLSIHRSLAEALAMLAGSLAALAAGLASVGIYGVMAFLVTQRVREIGIRVALGAGAAQMLRAVILGGLRPVAAGIAIGIAAAAGLSSLLHSTLALPGASDLLYGVPFYDPATFLAFPLLLATIACAASAVPAHRALRIDPAAALRSQ